MLILLESLVLQGLSSRWGRMIGFLIPALQLWIRGKSKQGEKLRASQRKINILRGFKKNQFPVVGSAKSEPKMVLK